MTFGYDIVLLYRARNELMYPSEGLCRIKEGTLLQGALSYGSKCLLDFV